MLEKTRQLQASSSLWARGSPMASLMVWQNSAGLARSSFLLHVTLVPREHSQGCFLWCRRSQRRSSSGNQGVSQYLARDSHTVICAAFCWPMEVTTSLIRLTTEGKYILPPD